MISAIKRFFSKIAEQAEENRRLETERLQMLRENNEAWAELNRDFINDLNRKTDNEIDDFTDVSKVPEPDAYNFDGSPLSR